MSSLPRNASNPSNDEATFTTVKMSINKCLKEGFYFKPFKAAIDNVVMFSSCIAVRGSLLHNYIITKCAMDESQGLTKDMFEYRFMYGVYSDYRLPPEALVPRDQLIEGQDIPIPHNM